MTWEGHFESIFIGKTNDDWHFSQEGIRVSLIWGSQALQRIAQEVHTSESKVIITEKMSVIAHLASRYTCVQEDLDEAQRILMLAQHHDPWIVPYNGLNKFGTWADQIERWTDEINTVAGRITAASISSFDNDTTNAEKAQGFVRVYNTLGTKRKKLATAEPSRGYADLDLEANGYRSKRVSYSVGKEGGKIRLLFEADVPPFSCFTYRIKQIETGKRTVSGSGKIINGGEYVVENDMYKIIFDLSRGGIIKSLAAKKKENKEFAEQSGECSIGGLKGYFYDEGKFRSSTGAPAKLTVLRSDTQKIKIKLEGRIASYPFIQVVNIARREKHIDFDLTINWKKNAGIGEYKGDSQQDSRRAYCDDRFKSSVLFPVNLHSLHIYKNAPFDVCENKLDDTLFNSWGQTKHNITLHWVDLAGQEGDYALTSFVDHTTFYSHEKDYPLGLIAQYSGNGFWGPDYKITGLLKMKYTIVPHHGRWDKAIIATKSDCWNEPLLCSYYSFAKLESRSLIDLRNTDYRVGATNIKDGKIILRLFNAEGDREQHNITFDMPLSSTEEVDLNGRVIGRRTIRARTGESKISISVSRFGLKTSALNLDRTYSNNSKL